MDLRLAALALCALSAPLAAQDRITERMLCDPADPANNCPIGTCVCVDETLEVVFDQSGKSVLPLEGPVAGRDIHVSVFMEARSSEIHAWSYGIAHDATVLELRNVTFEGTEHEALFNRLFHILMKDDIVTCQEPHPAKCVEDEPGGGFVSSIILSLGEFVNLPRGRIELSRAIYTVPPVRALEDDTKITFSENLGLAGSPPVLIGITNGGRSTRPTFVRDGWILVEPRAPFHRGDPDGDGLIGVGDAVQVLLGFLGAPITVCLEAGDFDDDGRIDGMDAILILRWLFLHGAPPASPGPPGLECGPDPSLSPADLGCREYPAC